MILQIERDELVDIFKEITLKEIEAGVDPGLALEIAHGALETFFKTDVDIKFEYPR